MTRNDNLKVSRFANCMALLTGNKTILLPSSIAEETRHHSAAAIGFDAGANHGFGAEENDWLGAEAYIDSLC